MKLNVLNRAQLVLLALIAFVAVQPVQAQRDYSAAEKSADFGIQQLFGNQNNRPIVINRSGEYRLRNGVTVRSGDAIVITASNVTLDLGSQTVSTEANGTGRGIFVNNASGVEIKNGRVGGFNTNVSVANGVNVKVNHLQIVGRGLAPNNGPSEIGVLLLETRGAVVSENLITSVNLGIFVRGGNSTGNRLAENTIVGGTNAANNLLGICYNPASGDGSDPNNAGPRGDNIYKNHIARYNFAIALSAGSVSNIFNENTLASFTNGFRETEALTTNGGTNISENNLSVILP